MRNVLCVRACTTSCTLSITRPHTHTRTQIHTQKHAHTFYRIRSVRTHENSALCTFAGSRTAPQSVWSCCRRSVDVVLMPPKPLESVSTALDPTTSLLSSASSSGLKPEQQILATQPRQSSVMNALQGSPEAGGSAGPRPGYIPLTMLIDFIIQRTYHDLTVLAEL